MHDIANISPILSYEFMWHAVSVFMFIYEITNENNKSILCYEKKCNDLMYE